MESIYGDGQETVPAMESETSLPTTTFAGYEDNICYPSLGPEQIASLGFNLFPFGVGDQWPAVATRECASSPTQHLGKRRRARGHTGSMEAVLLSPSYQERIWMTELDGENSNQLYPPEVWARKGHSPDSIDGGYKPISNSTPSGLLTRPSNIDGGGKEPGHPSITFQSAVPSRHSANPMSANTPGPQSCNQNSGSGVPPVSSYRTPQKLTTPSGSKNSSGSGSGSRGGSTRSSSSHSVTPSKRSDKTANSEEGPKALRMMCWHSASGVDCSGGRSDEARHLLSDHTMKEHTLSPPCQRCNLIFDSKDALDAHCSHDVPCKPFPKDGLQPANEEICQTGATPARLEEIKKRVSSFGKRMILPPECEGKEEELEKWVASNIDEYIGQSQTTSDRAKRELGKWFIVWYMFFPKRVIPNSPFVATTRRKRRYCQLLEPVLLAYGLESAKVLELRSFLLDSVDTVELEIAKAEHAKRGKRQNQSSSPLSNSTASQPNSSPPSQSDSVISSNNSRLSKTSLNAPEDPFTNAVQDPRPAEATSRPTLDFSLLTRATLSPPTPSPPRQASSATTHTQQWSDDMSGIPDNDFPSPVQAPPIALAEPLDSQSAPFRGQYTTSTFNTTQSTTYNENDTEMNEGQLYEHILRF